MFSVEELRSEKCREGRFGFQFQAQSVPGIPDCGGKDMILFFYILELPSFKMHSCIIARIKVILKESVGEDRKDSTR